MRKMEEKEKLQQDLIQIQGQVRFLLMELQIDLQRKKRVCQKKIILAANQLRLAGYYKKTAENQKEQEKRKNTYMIQFNKYYNFQDENEHILQKQTKKLKEISDNSKKSQERSRSYRIR